MSRTTNQLVENYWAGQLENARFLTRLVGVRKIRLIDRNKHSDPPDSLYEGFDEQGVKRYLWMEIAGAWRSGYGAKRVFDVVEGKRPPLTGRHGIICEPDKVTAASVVRVLLSKLQKTSYKNLVSCYGRGHLHVFISTDHYPLIDKNTLVEIRMNLPITELESQSMFKSMSIGFREHKESLWIARDVEDRLDNSRLFHWDAH